ncbi:uncharacterized protein FTOL_08895 [Fusarium torulosum]|uniref:Uncharacterized protein n=1 Tax=Fusarium torulosum TaxID=33205 RepID=A0AAE8MEL7_9HYPO|nr:uncharacterized protein FTOL_08895 [Fusarium torulosum]
MRLRERGNHDALTKHKASYVLYFTAQQGKLGHSSACTSRRDFQPLHKVKGFIGRVDLIVP